jgi:hypothetical protein
VDGEKNKKFAVQISFIPKLLLPLCHQSSQTNKAIMSEVKYSRKEFEGYTHRFVVNFKVDDDWRNDTKVDIYSNCDSYEQLEEIINKSKSKRVVSFKIEHRATKEQDDAVSKMIDEWINGDL